MNRARVAERGLATLRAERAVLADFRLCFDKSSASHAGIGHAHIRFERDACVEGVLYELSTETEILKMDPFEKAPWNYGRDVVQVATDSGQAWAWTYFANPAVLQVGLRPDPAYLAHLLAGQDFLSQDYLTMLNSFGTSPGA